MTPMNTAKKGQKHVVNALGAFQEWDKPSLRKWYSDQVLEGKSGIHRQERVTKGKEQQTPQVQLEFG